MTDRRRARRYLLCASATGCARVQQDALIDELAADRAIVFASAPARRDESLLMLQTADDQDVTACDAKVIESTPVMRGGIVQFRLELKLQRTRALGLQRVTAAS
jgi:hypothetical protein